MARLNDVKVLDMKDGKVTKIEREGVKYELTDEKAREGDVIFNIRGRADRLKDEYYEVVKVDEYARVEDEAGGINGYSHVVQGEFFKVFRKKYCKWAEIGRKPNEYKVGDIVRVLEDNANCSCNMKDDIGTIETADEGVFTVKVPSRPDLGNLHSARTIELIAREEDRFDVLED